MNPLFIPLIAIAMAITFGVLIAGLVNMARNGEAARQRSNKLMRWRVAMQLVAVLLVALAFVTA